MMTFLLTFACKCSFLVFFFFFFGGGGGVVFHHQASIFLQWAYGSNDLPRPRRSALSECF